jgi:hypothetical protein
MDKREKKEKLIQVLEKIALIVWGLSIITGALIGGSDGSMLLGGITGLLFGLGIVILNAFVVGIIEDPTRLMSFVIFIPVGCLIGLIWGSNGAIIGSISGGILAFLFVADMIKKK